jgi:IS5 family transposase
VRLGDDLLAAAPRLAGGRRLEAAPTRAAQPPARRRPDRLDAGCRRCLDGARKKGGPATGPNPTDRGKPGTKRHLVSDARGIPLAEFITAANVNEVTVLERLIDSIPPVRGRVGRPRRRPEKLHADKGYRSRRNQPALQARGIQSRIARPMIDASERLGRHRWVVERTFAWLNQMKRLVIRYERRADIHDALLSLACSLICFRFLQRRCV